MNDPIHPAAPAARGHSLVRALARGLLLLALGMLSLLGAAPARADCLFTQGAMTNVLFTLPSTIAVPIDTPNGTVIHTTSQIAPVAPPSVQCAWYRLGGYWLHDDFYGYERVRYGVNNLVGAQPDATEYTFPTGIPGLGYRITHGDNSTYLYPRPCCQKDVSKTVFSVASSLQLVKTGPIAPGSTLASGNLANWQWNDLVPEMFVLSNPVTILQPGCSANDPSKTVTLPTVSVSAFNGIGSTAGTKRFTIDLTCYAGATLKITLDTNSPAGNQTGVIKGSNGQGQAKGIGVQLLDKTGTPVDFGAAATVGATQDGALSLTYFARYYQTNNNLTPGATTAKATFTLSYQ